MKYVIKPDFSQFFKDTHLTLKDLMPELAVFTLIWHEANMGSAMDVMERKDYYITLPFLFKIRTRLEADGRWPKERNTENCSLLTAILMLKASQAPHNKVEKIRRQLTAEAAKAGLFASGM